MRASFYDPSKRKPVKQKRLCLRCQKKFGSSGIGNRICGQCTADNYREGGIRCLRVIVDRKGPGQ